VRVRSTSTSARWDASTRAYCSRYGGGYDRTRVAAGRPTIAEDVFKIGGNRSARAVACSWPAAARAPVKLLDNADVSIVNASPCS